MKKPLVCLLAANMAVAASAATIYVKANPEVVTQDGLTWATAYTNIADAVVAATTAGDQIRVAGGVYKVAASISPTVSISIYGGFPGISDEETLANRDKDLHQSIITMDLNGNDVWIHVEPNYDNYSVIQTTTEIPLISAAGKVNLPMEFTGQYDTYVAGNNGEIKPDRGAFYIKNSNAGCTFDGLWFVGCWGQNVFAAAAISGLDGTSGSPVSVNDCMFVGNTGQEGSICGGTGTGNTLTVNGSKFYYIRSLSRAGGLANRNTTVVSGCEFIGTAKFGTDHLVGAVIYGWTGAASFKNIVVARTLVAGTGINSNYGGPALVYSSEGGSAVFDGLIVTNNLQLVGSTAYNVPFFNTRSCSRITDLFFAGNRHVTKGGPGQTYAFFRPSSSYHSMMHRFTIADNHIKVATTTAVAGDEYGVGILGNNQGQYTLLDGTFSNNKAIGVRPAGVNVALSDGIILSRYVVEGPVEAGVANCTFAGDGGNPLYVVNGAGYNMSQNVVNCIFRNESDDDTPCAFASQGAGGTVNLVDSSVNGYDVPDSFVAASGLETDPILLAPLAWGSGGAIPARLPASRPPLLNTTADVTTNNTSHTIARYRLRGAAATDWLRLTASQVQDTDNKTMPLADALGNARMFGNFARGAVQTLTAAAEGGHTLIIRKAPRAGGTLSAPGAVQVVALDGDITPVTATPAGGCEFLGWYEEDGTTLISEESTLTAAEISLSADTVIIAKFSTPLVQITWSLDGKGVFTANGQSTYVQSLPAGTFLTVPGFTMDGAWLYEGWTPGLPGTVPWEATTYTAKYVSTGLRTIHLIPADDEGAEASAKNGESWADAYTDFGAAVDDAGRFRGEVWMKTGKYPISNIFIPDNVTLRGGFAGHESSAAAADPAANPVIITGDANDDAYWYPNHVNPAVASRMSIWNGLAFNAPYAMLEAIYYVTPNGNQANHADYGVDLADGATNIVFEGVTFTLFKINAIRYAGNARLVMRGCRLLANGNGNNYSYHPVYGSDGSIEMRGCEVAYNHSGVRIAGGGGAHTNIFADCTFIGNACSGYGSAIDVAGPTHVRIEGCYFEKNSARSEVYRGSSVRLGSTGTIGVRDCEFQDNRVFSHAHGLIVFESTPSGVAKIERCRFIGNRLDEWSVKAAQSPRSAALAVMGGATVLVSDSLFQDNYVIATNKESNAVGHASVFAANNGYTTFLNTTILGNRFDDVEVDSGLKSSYGTILIYGADRRVAFVNSIISGSVLDEYSHEIWVTDWNANGTFAMINSVVRNDSADYKLFNVKPAFAPVLINSALTGIDTGAFVVEANTVITNVSSATVAVKGRLSDNGSVKALSIAASSPFARAGRPVWLSTDDYVYYYDANYGVGLNKYPWRRAVNRLQNYAEGNVVLGGLTTESGLIPDAFGNARLPGKISYGPLNNTESGMMLLFR